MQYTSVNLAVFMLSYGNWGLRSANDNTKVTGVAATKSFVSDLVSSASVNHSIEVTLFAFKFFTDLRSFTVLDT